MKNASTALLLASALAFVLAAPLVAIAKEEKLSHDLDGTEILYTYDNGTKYDLKYTAEGVRYRFLSGDAPDEWWGPFPYKAFRIRDGEYFAGWYEKGYGDQITHLVDFNTKTLYGSGIIVKKDKVIEHFQSARIEKIIKK